jgi:enoyl-CoA hydratase/carnithine racemase
MMEVVRFERQSSLGHIILASPPGNLINIEFSECLRRAVHAAGASNIRALLVRAEGPNFSQGGDILDFIDRDAKSFRTFVGEVHQSYRAIEALEIPTVCAVRGAAVGGGLELVLACDLAVAAENAVFFNVEASVGSAPLAGAVQRLASRIGRARAARYALLSEKYSGVVAGQLGVVSHVVPESEVESTALELAQKLSVGPTQSYAAIRSLLKAWSGGGISAADALQLDLTMGLHSTEDARRGRTARVEALKKGVEPSPPVFEGR